MKRAALILIFSLAPAICLSACVPVGQPAAYQVSEAYIQTAVASTLAAERALAAGAELYQDATQRTGTPGDGTPGTAATPEDTPATPGQEGEPTPENPWMLQSWCADHDGCVLYDVSNRTDSWLQIELKESDTGVTGFFTVQSKTVGRITLIPGHYNVRYTWWCGGEVGSLTENKAIGSWIDMFKCPQGFYQRVNK